nr:M48 family metalloprotease [Halomarina salina]
MLGILLAQETASLLTGAESPESWGPLPWLLLVAWHLLVLVGLVRVAREWGETARTAVAESVRSAFDTTGKLFPDTPTRPAEDDRLRSTTAALAQQADLPLPDLLVAETDAPEILTVGYRPATTTLVVTEGLLATLDDAELEAAVAHELAHVKNRDAAVMTAASSVVAGARLVRQYAWGMGPRSSPQSDGLGLFAIPVSLVMVPVTLLGRVLVAVLSRTRERAADRGAVAITGNPSGLASALKTLDATLDRPPVADLRHEEVVALSIVPPPREPIVAKQSWERRRPILWSVQKPIRRGIARLRRWIRRVYSTHPTTDERVERLGALERRRGSP